MHRTARFGLSLLIYLLLSVAILPPSARADDIKMKSVGKVRRQGITIIGDQELPKVLYIVPWKLPSLPPPIDLRWTQPPYLAPVTPCQIGFPRSPEHVIHWPCPSHSTP